MKLIKIFGVVMPVYLLMISIVAASLIISGVVYAYVNILQQHDFGYMRIGESKTITILEIQNGTLQPYTLNISTLCNGSQSINGILSYPDQSGIIRTQPLAIDSVTTFTNTISNQINLTINSIQAGQWSCELDFINDTSTYMNFTEVEFP